MGKGKVATEYFNPSLVTFRMPLVLEEYYKAKVINWWSAWPVDFLVRGGAVLILNQYLIPEYLHKVYISGFLRNCSG